MGSITVTSPASSVLFVADGALRGDTSASALFTDAFMDFTSGILSVTGINATGHIFASYPARHLSILGGFVDQVSSGRCDPLTSDCPPPHPPV